MKLRTERKETWVPITQDGETAEVLLRPLTPKESQALLKAATESEWERNQRFETVNFYTFRVLKIDSIIRDWKGVEDINGAVIPCTKDNKELVYQLNPQFMDKVIDAADKLADRAKADADDITKN